ncbi:Uncharacterised protein [Streptococcus pneumoniae]|nr:Uncharacterised protein [Streptococcus pneumoniae]
MNLFPSNFIRNWYFDKCNFSFARYFFWKHFFQHGFIDWRTFEQIHDNIRNKSDKTKWHEVANISYHLSYEDHSG